MLKKDINKVFRHQMELKDLFEKIGQLVGSIVDNSDIDSFKKYFGHHAFKRHLSSQQALEDNIKKFKAAQSMEQKGEYLNAYMTTIFMRVTFHYACYKGNVTVVSYLIKKQHFPGEMDARQEHIQHITDKEIKIKGRPLCLAVQSENLELVKYLYNNTSAMMEASVGQTLETTPLMIASKQGNEAIIKYLLKHGANPNAEKLASNTSPLRNAIEAKNIAVIQLLVNSGAIVTNIEVINAIEQGLSLEAIEFLLLNNIEQEDPYNPYLMSAIQSGQINSLTALEMHPEITPFSRISKFSSVPLEKRMIKAAAKSGNIDMLMHLQETHKIDIKKWVTEENQKRDTQLSSGKQKSSMSHEDTILYAAVKGDSAQNKIVFLHYLFETLDARPSDAVLKELCAMSVPMRPVAYLYSFMPEYLAQKEELRAIAFGLENLDLFTLFKTYNSKFIQNGNILEMHRHNRFPADIESLIKSKLEGLSPSALEALLGTDKEARIGALFYYSADNHDKKSAIFSVLLTNTFIKQIINTADIQNCMGDTLASYAFWHMNYHQVDLLLQLGANPDTPNNKGETLLNRTLSSTLNNNFNSIKTYVGQVTHSLRYASKEAFGGSDKLRELLIFTGGDTHGVPILELVENSITKHQAQRKLKELFIYFPEDHAREMVRLLKDPSFVEQHKIDKYDLASYFDSFKKVSEEQLSKEDVESRLRTDEPKQTDIKELTQVGNHYPFFLQHLKVQSRHLTPQKVANALWLLNKDGQVIEASKSQFRLWAESKDLSFIPDDVDTCLSGYVMKK